MYNFAVKSVAFAISAFVGGIYLILIMLGINIVGFSMSIIYPNMPSIIAYGVPAYYIIKIFNGFKFKA